MDNNDKYSREIKKTDDVLFGQWLQPPVKYHKLSLTNNAMKKNKNRFRFCDQEQRRFLRQSENIEHV